MSVKPDNATKTITQKTTKTNRIFTVYNIFIWKFRFILFYFVQNIYRLFFSKMDNRVFWLRRIFQKKNVSEVIKCLRFNIVNVKFKNLAETLSANAHSHWKILLSYTTAIRVMMCWWKIHWRVILKVYTILHREIVILSLIKKKLCVNYFFFFFRISLWYWG